MTTMIAAHTLKPGDTVQVPRGKYGTTQVTVVSVRVGASRTTLMLEAGTGRPWRRVYRNAGPDSLITRIDPEDTAR